MRQQLISVVDDDASMLEVIASLLRSMDFEVNIHRSAEDFMRSPSCRSSDCLITDIHMPGLSGIELKHWLDGEGIAVPVIMITARPEAHLHDRALACGAVSLLRKPFEFNELIASLGRAGITPDAA